MLRSPNEAAIKKNTAPLVANHNANELASSPGRSWICRDLVYEGARLHFMWCWGGLDCRWIQHPAGDGKEFCRLHQLEAQKRLGGSQSSTCGSSVSWSQLCDEISSGDEAESQGECQGQQVWEGIFEPAVLQHQEFVDVAWEDASVGDRDDLMRSDPEDKVSDNVWKNCADSVLHPYAVYLE
jgi:hypothetical protein